MDLLSLPRNPRVLQNSNSENYYTVEEALQILEPSTVGFEATAGTDIVKAFEKAIEIRNEFSIDDDMAYDKSCTLILCTDGKHFEHENDQTIQAAEVAKVGVISEQFQVFNFTPNVACIALGSDADVNLLIGISTVPSVLHQHLFEKSNLLNQLQKDSSGQFRLCIVGHQNNRIGKEVDIIRRFLIIGTSTRINRNGN
ncbi:MAG: hypothetical protein IPN14_08270 [Bacteroidetes bacterium]|nr:hypothetical protein [Bacteroidota bacterium]